MRIPSKVRTLIAGLLSVAILLCSCSSSKSDTAADRCTKYIGEVDYASTVSALVYEQVPDEEGRYGIVYRAVSDMDGLLAQTQTPVCLYFYDYMSGGEVSGVTAGVEDLAQSLYDQVLFVAVDGIAEYELGDKYGVDAYPEFVLIVPGKQEVKFEGMNFEAWTINDVAVWMAQNGYTPDMAKLDEGEAQ